MGWLQRVFMLVLIKTGSGFHLIHAPTLVTPAPPNGTTDPASRYDLQSQPITCRADRMSRGEATTHLSSPRQIR